MKLLHPILILTSVLPLLAHPIDFQGDPFRQLEEIWPTPTESRLASGAPGPKYWQQQVDYDITVALNEKTDVLTGEATIVYHNRSPHSLSYLWMQLDRNKFTPDSLGHQSSEAPALGSLTFDAFEALLHKESFDGGVKIKKIETPQGQKLTHQIVDTMMRVDLPNPLASGQKFTYRIAWQYKLSDSKTTWGRSNMEEFDDGTKIFQIAQWFPRLCSYSDVRGWQNKAFLGRGEFALEFGNYRVAITAPDHHVVTATGELRNPIETLKPEWEQRLKQAESAKKPVFIITPEEAAENQKSSAKGTKTWVFEAKNVRDFAWASSSKFIWDALRHPLATSKKPVWAMSFYPPEAEPLWSQYSTQSIIHTLNVYSKFTFDYPYPVAISVNGPVYGMEYPMLTFNGPRPESDGTYTERTKNALISVIIHEIGHNWFPMVVNTDERQWTWMDEGMNSFLQILAEAEWRENYPSRANPSSITGYMTSSNQRPIMTNSESLLQFAANSYSKPAIGFIILRETIMGRELFDHAFREYAQRWMFKKPEPADFFRTMQDASGLDLDWFWHSWFYTTHHVDLGVTHFTRHVLDSRSPDDQADQKREEREQQQKEDLTTQRNKTLPKFVAQNPELRDFYDQYDPLEVTDEQRERYHKFLQSLTPKERRLLRHKHHLTTAHFVNQGGVIMPIVVELHLQGGKKITQTIPAEIWKLDPKKVTKLFLTDKPVERIVIDPLNQTADANLTNNTWPPLIQELPFTLEKKGKDFDNPMKRARAKEAKAKQSKEAKEPEVPVRKKAQQPAAAR